MLDSKKSLTASVLGKSLVGTSYSLRKVLMRGSIGNFGLKIVATLFGFASSIMLARNLDLNEFGLFAYIIALISFLSLPATAGVPSLIIRETSKAISDDDWGKVRGLWRWGWLVIGLFSLLIIVLASIIASLFSHYFKSSDLEVFYLALLLIPLFALGGMRSGVLRGLHHVVLGEVPDMLLRPVLFFFFLLLIVYVSVNLQLSPLVAVSLQFVALLISFVAGTVILWMVIPEQLKRKPKPVYETKRWIRALVPLAMISGMVPLLQYTDILMLGVLESVDQVALYRVALSISLMVSFGLQSVSAAMAPHLARLYHHGDLDRLQHIVFQSTKVVIAFSFFVVAFLVVFGDDLLGFFYGSKFVAAYTPLAILVVGQFVKSLTGAAAMLLNMTGNENSTASILGKSVVINIVLNLTLIPIWGMNGAAIATVITILIRNIMLRSLVKKNLGIEVSVFHAKNNRL